MRPADEVLALGYGELVVDPLVLRIPLPGIAVFDWDKDIVRAVNVLEVLKAPRVCFAYGHPRKMPQFDRDEKGYRGGA